MAYVPNNLAIFTAAFAGAIAGMGSSGRVISDPVSADYSFVTDAAGAFAQAFDTAWGVSVTTELDLASIQEVCETAFQDRSPPVGAPFNLPSNYTTLVLALIALVKEGDIYFTNQGIVSPSAGGGGSNQIAWFFNNLIGLDTNPGTAALPRKTCASIMTSLQPVAQKGKNYQIVCQEDFPSTDSFAPSWLKAQNTEDVNGVTGARQVVNMTLSGTLKPVAGTSTLVTAFTATGVNQALITLASAAVVTAQVDQLFRITASAAPGNVGATFGIGRDMGAGVARIIDITAAPGLTLVLGSIVGSTVEAVTASKMDSSVIQIGDSQGRYQVNYFHFPLPAAPPADQKNITQRNVNITFQGCKFERPFQYSFGTAASVVGCLVIGNATFTTFTGVGGAYSHVNTLFKNLELQMSSGITFNQINGVYLENSTWRSGITGTVPDYGSVGGSSVTKGFKQIMIAGNGLSIYNWPSAGLNTGMLLIDGAECRMGGIVRGGFDGPTPAGAVGINVFVGDLMVASTITPTIAGDSGGTGADIRLQNPLGTVDLACRGLQGGVMAIAAAGAVTLDAQALKTWAVWAGAGATDFNRYAFNPHTGSRVVNTPV